MTMASELQRDRIRFPILLILTVILCLAAIQVSGVDSALLLATTAVVLVFCSRPPVHTTWEILEQVYLMRTSSKGMESFTDERPA